MDKLVEILEDLVPDGRFENNDDLVGSGVLDSITLLNLIGEISDEFGVEITVADMVPENFKSLDTIMALIERLKG